MKLLGNLGVLLYLDDLLPLLDQELLRVGPGLQMYYIKFCVKNIFKGTYRDFFPSREDLGNMLDQELLRDGLRLIYCLHVVTRISQHLRRLKFSK